MATQFTILSINDSGLSTDSYCTLYYENSIGPIIKGIMKNGTAGITLGTDCTPSYWSDPTLGSGNFDTSSDKTSTEGINIVFDIIDCSGVYSKSAISLANWNYNLNGIEIDTLSRPDMNFVIGGDLACFKDSVTTWSGGYWALANNAQITFTNSTGINLLSGGSSQTIRPIFWRYNQHGMFALSLPLKLDLTNAGGSYTFTDPDFILSDCILSIKLLDKNNIVKADKTYTGITIDPPNIIGSITANGNIFKTVSDINYTMIRNPTKGNLTYTEIHNVTKHRYDMVYETTVNTLFPSYFNDGKATDTLTVLNSDMGRGDYSYISYSPMLQGIKPGVKGGTAVTNMVTNCKGHRFSLDKVSLKIKSGVAFGSDILDEVGSQNPYIYVDNTSVTGVLRVTFDANHEDWTTSTNRDNYADENIYPYLSKIYLIASLPNNIESEFAPFKSTFIPYDTVQTYPNIDFGIGVLNSILTLDGLYTTTTTLGGSDTSLSGQTIDVVILKSGKYKVFLALVDQYNQVSFWCITNKIKNYNTV